LLDFASQRHDEVETLGRRRSGNAKTCMILDHTLREIRERNRAHFKADSLSSDQSANDIRDLLAHIDELTEELDCLQADDDG
jgi:hypothetical protein